MHRIQTVKAQSLLTPSQRSGWLQKKMLKIIQISVKKLLNKMKILNKLVSISIKGKSIKSVRFVGILIFQRVNNYH